MRAFIICNLTGLMEKSFHLFLIPYIPTPFIEKDAHKSRGKYHLNLGIDKFKRNKSVSPFSPSASFPFATRSYSRFALLNPRT